MSYISHIFYFHLRECVLYVLLELLDLGPLLLCGRELKGSEPDLRLLLGDASALVERSQLPRTQRLPEALGELKRPRSEAHGGLGRQRRPRDHGVDFALAEESVLDGAGPSKVQGLHGCLSALQVRPGDLVDRGPADAEDLRGGGDRRAGVEPPRAPSGLRERSLTEAPEGLVAGELSHDALPQLWRRLSEVQRRREARDTHLEGIQALENELARAGAPRTTGGSLLEDLSGLCVFWLTLLPFGHLFKIKL